MLPRYADNRDPSSLAAQFRARRLAFFQTLLSPLPKPLKILDAGGTEIFWEVMGLAGQNDFQITLLNLEPVETRHSNLRGVRGDVLDMRNFGPREFDVVFSNAVIEHVGNFKDQMKMAEEIQRVGQRYFLQTPNLYFPLEPHFLIPFFQFFPLWLRVFLIRNFDMGWREKVSDIAAAEKEARSVRLLTRNELKRLFPNAVIKEEKVFGLTKSFMVYGGFGP